jgi:hypothetical protein
MHMYRSFLLVLLRYTNSTECLSLQLLADGASQPSRGSCGVGAAASTLSDDLGDPAQCAALTARVLTHACAQRLKMPCPRYSPSDLYNELQTGAGCSRAPAGAACDPEALGILRQGTRAQLQQLNSDRRALALKSLARRVGEQASLLALCGRPANAAEQRELGWAAVRCAAMSKETLGISKEHAAA